MRMIPSLVKQRLAHDLPVLFFCPTPSADTAFVEMAALTGYHGLWIDHEHQNYTDPQMANFCLACRAGGMDAMIRVRKATRGSYFRTFEIGACGVMLPHCNSAEEAADFVCELKFPPVGNRSLDGVEPPARFAWVPAAEYTQQANEETFIVVQIEEPEAVAHVDAIAAVPGVDVLFVGPADLKLRYRELGAPQSPLAEEAILRVAAAARQHHKHWGIPVGSPEDARLRLEQGGRFLAHGSVFGCVFGGLQQIQKQFGEWLGKGRRK